VPLLNTKSLLVAFLGQYYAAGLSLWVQCVEVSLIICKMTEGDMLATPLHGQA
jgi:hypothetical protein